LTKIRAENDFHIFIPKNISKQLYLKAVKATDAGKPCTYIGWLQDS